MLEPGVSNAGRHAVALQGLLENLQPARELPSHDRVACVRHLQRQSSILHVRAEKTGGELELQLLDPLLVGIAEEKTDHAVFEDPIDEAVDDLSEPGLPAQLLIERPRHFSFSTHFYGKRSGMSKLTP